MKETDLFTIAIEEAKKFTIDNRLLTEKERSVFARAWVRGYHKCQEHQTRTRMGLDLK